MKSKYYILIMLFCTSFSTLAQSNLTLKEMENKAKEEQRQRRLQTSGDYSYTIWDDIPDMKSWGIVYSYNKTYPLTLQLNYQVSYLSCALDLGVGFNKNPQYVTQNKTLKTNFQAMLSPGVYFKYVSINFGVGCAFASTNKSDYISITDVSDGNGSVSTSSSSSISYSTSSVTGRLLLKPSLTGYIPIDDEYHFITVSVGYDFAPNFKAINGFTFGAGFQLPLD